MKKIPLLENIRIINEDRTNTKKGCVLIDVNPIGISWEEIISKIDEKDLYVKDGEFGLEHEPHTTILYGILLDQESDPNYREGLRKQLIEYYKKYFPKLTIKGISVSLFENEYDVLKFDVEVTPELAAANKYLTYYYPYENSYADNYHPHVTIAYIKKGEGQKYCDKFNVPQEFKTTNLVWSEDEYKFILTPTIIGPVVTCRDKKTKELVGFDSTTFEITKKIS